MSRLAPAMIAALLTMSAAAADDKARKVDPAEKNASAPFESLDKNADQQISKVEAAGDKMLSDNFAIADANGDGYVSKSEYLARHKG